MTTHCRNSLSGEKENYRDQGFLISRWYVVWRKTYLPKSSNWQMVQMSLSAFSNISMQIP